MNIGTGTGSTFIADGRDRPLFGVGMISMSFSLALLTLGLGIILFSYGAEEIVTARQVSIFLFLLCACAGVLSWNRYVVPGLLLVLTEICCYIADASFRASIQKQLEYKLATFASFSGRDVYFVGHSLGSVICLDQGGITPTYCGRKLGALKGKRGWIGTRTCSTLLFTRHNVVFSGRGHAIARA